MKIIHVVAGFSIDFPGGITNYVRTLAASQIADGHVVSVIDGAEATRNHPDGFKVVGYKGNIRPFVVSCKVDVDGTARLNRILEDELPDLIHFHLTVGFGEDFYEQFTAKGLKYVVSMHDYYLICPRITMMDYAGRNCGGPERRKCEMCIGQLDQVDLLYKAARRVHVTLPRIPSHAVTARNEKIGTFLRGAAAVLPVSDRVRELAAGSFPDLRYVVAHIGNSSAVAERPAKTPSPKLRLSFMG
ncbi:glycosyltransferase, partial [Arthrobacter sp. HMWF013]|uniref:glycosyltransferase n=1 Tax=Arthrobacter sp. HMWF013 TaxID=2056849 RepID=UPI0015E820EB